MADLKIQLDTDDLILDGWPITNLEQVDVIILMSTSAAGLQQKMDSLYQWCATNFLILNTIKSVVMIMGRKLQTLPQFKFGTDTLSLVEKQFYVGILFQARRNAVFRKHYNEKAAKAQRVGRMICGLESLIGTLHARDAIKLYMALVDPHLTHGCKIILDTNSTALEKLEKVQIAFLRRVMAIGSRCILVILYTEMGVMPIRYRRLLLALCYLQHLIAARNSQLIMAALKECVKLMHQGHDNWLKSLWSLLEGLPFQLCIPQFMEVPTAEETKQLITDLTSGLNTLLLQELNASEKLYLLRDRWESGDPPWQAALLLRQYMMVTNLDHRRAIANIATSSHLLAVEALRHVRPAPVHEQRKCRFCT
jgi:hypothetical protein